MVLSNLTAGQRSSSPRMLQWQGPDPARSIHPPVARFQTATGSTTFLHCSSLLHEMTLNITVATAKCIYQCADYQMTEMKTRMPATGGIQKIFIVNTFRWSATVCYSGVAKYSNVVDVEEWLSDQIGKINPKDSLNHLIEQLLRAATG